MRKCVLLPAAAVAGGVVGLLVRRVYLANGFEAGTGLPIAGAPSLWAMAIVTVVVLGLLVALSCGKHKNYTQCYTGSFYSEHTVCIAGMLAGAVLLGVGGFLALANWFSSPSLGLMEKPLRRELSVTWFYLGIFCLLAAAGIYFVTQKMRQKEPILTAWAAMPTLAGCLWVVANYYDHWAEEPVLGHYAIPMLATGLSMLGCMMIGAMGFDKARISTTLAFSLSGASVCVMALADGLNWANTAILLGMVFYQLSMASALIANDDRAPGLPACAAHCKQCHGCAPMGTMPKKKKKAKKKTNESGK